MTAVPSHHASLLGLLRRYVYGSAVTPDTLHSRRNAAMHCSCAS